VVDSNDRYDLGSLFERAKRFCLVNIRWITRFVMVLLAVLLLLHALYSPSVAWLGKVFHLATPSLAAILALVVIVWVLERVLVLQEEIRRPAIVMSDTRLKAYEHLSELIKFRRPKKVDLLQVSGVTALSFMRFLAGNHPGVQVRLLLMHTSVASQFDSDQKDFHRDRILHTIKEVGLIEAENPGFHVTKKYYKTPPGVSAIIIEPAAISISWYHCFNDPKAPSVTRVRGHLAPAVTAVDNLAQPLFSFASEQFKKVWATAEENYQ